MNRDYSTGALICRCCNNHSNTLKLFMSCLQKSPKTNDHLHSDPLSPDYRLKCLTLLLQEIPPYLVFEMTMAYSFGVHFLCGFRFLQSVSFSQSVKYCLEPKQYPAPLSPTHMCFSSTEPNIKAARLDGFQGLTVITICLLELSM